MLVLYGTEYGFAREIAAKLAAALRATGEFRCAKGARVSARTAPALQCPGFRVLT